MNIVFKNVENAHLMFLEAGMPTYIFIYVIENCLIVKFFKNESMEMPLFDYVLRARNLATWYPHIILWTGFCWCFIFPL